MAKDPAAILNELVDDVEELQEKTWSNEDDIENLARRVKKIERTLGIEKKKKPPTNGKH